LEKNISIDGLLGYKLINSSLINAEDLFGVNWENFIKNNNNIYSKLHFECENPFAKAYAFVRRPGFDDKHGKEYIELLYIKAEGISTYKYLYVKNNVTPKCLVSIVPGLAFGGNFGEYPEMLINTIKSTGKFPQYQFYDDQCEKDFNALIKHYDIVNQYNYNRPYYHWSSHFTLASLKDCINYTE